MLSAVADRAVQERQKHTRHHPEHERQKHPRHHPEHTFPFNNSVSSTNKRKPESHPGQSTSPRQRPHSSTNRDKGKCREPCATREQTITKIDEGQRTQHNPAQLTTKARHEAGKPPRASEVNQSDLDIANSNWRIDKDSDPPDEDPDPPKTMTGLERIADRRNLDQIERANLSDQQLLCKYLPSLVPEFLPNSITGPDDSFTTGPALLKAIRTVFEARVDVPLKPPIWFDVTNQAIQHNSGLLKDCNFDLARFLHANQNSTLAFGSEFRPVAQLETILSQHPNFDFFKQVLAIGMEFHFDQEPTETQRLAEVDEMMVRGNHQSAQESEDDVRRLLPKDVHHGFLLPVNLDIIQNLKGAMVQPAGLALQFGLLEDGSRVPKRRLTQDSKFALTFPNAPVNERIDMEAYPEMIYGWCLSRIVHFIVALRLRHPTKKIFIAKYDYSDAYRRIAHSVSAAAQSIFVVAGIAYIALRLTFGGSTSPPIWCAFSEMGTDLSNEIPLCDDWDPSTLRSPSQPITPTPIELPKNQPISLAKPMTVHKPTNVTGHTDSFTNDLIRVFLDTHTNRER
jgi:hypothetical protein